MTEANERDRQDRDLAAAVAQLQTLVREQRAELDELRAIVHAQRHEPPATQDRAPASGRVSRANLFKGLAIGAAGIAGAEITGTLGAGTASADTGTAPSYKAVGPATPALNTAFETSPSSGKFAYGVFVQGTNAGVFGEAIDSSGFNGSGDGVSGSSGDGNGVKGESSGIGVKGVADSNGIGVEGTSHYGNESTGLGTGPGVQGTSNAVGVFGRLGTTMSYGSAVAIGGPLANPAGVVGLSDRNPGPGVVGMALANDTGVIGASYALDFNPGGSSGYAPGNGVGVSGISGAGSGVSGQSSSGAGVYGSTDSGYGGQFQATNAQASPLYLVPSTLTTHPTSGAHLVGELYVDHNGGLYICVLAGSPGTWQKFVTATATDARLTSFTSKRQGDYVLFAWRVADGKGIAGFELYAGSQRLTDRTLRPHRARLYRHEARWEGRGPFALHVLLRAGGVIVVHAENG